MPRGTWNIADVELVEGRSRLKRSFIRTAALWTAAFLCVVLATIAGLNAAEAAPFGGFAAVGIQGLVLTAILGGIAGGIAGLTALLRRRAA